jgi:hypothetical protein
MPRGPIPDLPPTRPIVSEVVALARAYYKKPGNSVGGCLHIVLDDGNLADSHLQACVEWAKALHDEDGLVLATKLLAMSPTQRRKVYRSNLYPSSAPVRLPE